MSYSAGPGNYGGPPQGPSTQGYGQQGYGAPQAAGPGKGIGFYLNLAVVVLGILSFFLGFASFASEDSGYQGDGVFSQKSFNFFDNVGLGVGVIGLAVLLAAALTTAFSLLPAQKQNEPLVAGLSLTGFIVLLFLLICMSPGANAGIGLILVLVTSFLQAATAVAALLFAAGIIKPPAPRQQQYGYYGPGGGYPQQQSMPPGQYYSNPGSGGFPQQQPPQQQQPPHGQW
jgi:hypothetical protein